MLRHLIEGLFVTAVLLRPFLPDTARRILELLDQKWTMQDTADATGTYPREVRPSHDDIWREAWKQR